MTVRIYKYFVDSIVMLPRLYMALNVPYMLNFSMILNLVSFIQLDR